MRKIGIIPEQKIYLLFHWDGGLYQFILEDVSKYLDDIWYPGPDDIDIFDSTMNWVFSIHHEGYLSYLFLEKKD